MTVLTRTVDWSLSGHGENGPDPQHARFGAPRAEVASEEGRNVLSKYLVRELKQTTEYPTMDELRAHLRKRRPVSSTISGAELIREQRDC
jgi:hypothetical protein